jgi:hypothetical protein
MELIFTTVSEPNIFVPKGWNGTDIPCKQRTGQPSLTLTKEIRLTLPDKINPAFRAILAGKVESMCVNSLKHSIKVRDFSPNLIKGYKILYEKQGLSYSILKLNPKSKDICKDICKGILLLKKQAIEYSNGY